MFLRAHPRLIVTAIVHLCDSVSFTLHITCSIGQKSNQMSIHAPENQFCRTQAQIGPAGLTYLVRFFHEREVHLFCLGTMECPGKFLQ